MGKRMQNTTNSAWQEICFILSENIKQNINEKDFETQVIRAVEILGWKEFRKEISRQPTIPIGRKRSIRPDIVISSDNHQRIVIEIKKPSEDISLDKSIDQLKSYMRQKKADFGWLVGKEIRVYYDGNLNPHPDDLILLEKITYDKNAELGMQFVEIFSKSNFIAKEYESYLVNKMGKYNEEKEVDKLRKILLSRDTLIKIHDFLETEFSDFGVSIFEKAINKLNINITNIRHSIAKTVINEKKESCKKPNTVKKFQQKNKFDSHELSGKTFTLNQLIHKKLAYTKPQEIQIEGERYTVESWAKLTIKFVEWLNEKNLITKDEMPIYNHSKLEDKYFINSENQHKDSEKDAIWEPVGQFFVDIKYEADKHIRNIAKALEQLYINPNIEITFR